MLGGVAHPVKESADANDKATRTRFSSLILLGKVNGHEMNQGAYCPKSGKFAWQFATESSQICVVTRKSPSLIAAKWQLTGKLRTVSLPEAQGRLRLSSTYRPSGSFQRGGPLNVRAEGAVTGWSWPVADQLTTITAAERHKPYGHFPRPTTAQPAGR